MRINSVQSYGQYANAGNSNSRSHGTARNEKQSLGFEGAVKFPKTDITNALIAHIPEKAICKKNITGMHINIEFDAMNQEGEMQESNLVHMLITNGIDCLHAPRLKELNPIEWTKFIDKKLLGEK